MEVGLLTTSVLRVMSLDLPLRRLSTTNDPRWGSYNVPWSKSGSFGYWIWDERQNGMVEGSTYVSKRETETLVLSRTVLRPRVIICLRSHHSGPRREVREDPVFH